jgi:cell wall-associated NlpC family hydrolase
MFRKHLAPLHETRRDFLATAKLLLGTPYLWGGRGGLGIDCSGLIQIALAAAGIRCPRDSDQQRDAVGDEVTIPDDPSTLPAGDVFFFPGHVGFTLGGGKFLHASSFDMMVSVHPLKDVLRRVRERHGKDIVRVRRVKGA